MKDSSQYTKTGQRFIRQSWMVVGGFMSDETRGASNHFKPIVLKNLK